MPRLRLRHHTTRHAAGVLLACTVAAGIVGAGFGAGVAGAVTTVVSDDAGPEAPWIGLIGDSTLSGVRWYDDYGALEEFNFVFDAESCRRTIETSCWSREQYRAENAIGALRRLSGEWGDVLVMMSGYNDSNAGFGEAVDAIVAEARRQEIPTVMWLTLRTASVSYEEPLHRANGETYLDANATLREKADHYDGYLQLADWATHSAEREDWFEGDGVHLTRAGVDGVTSFIADQAGRVLDNEVVTPTTPSWDPLRDGDTGARVEALQTSLIAAGYTEVGEVDGVFGSLTADAVRELQRDHDLDMTGVADARTAVELGLYDGPAVIADEEPVVPAATTTSPRDAALRTAVLARLDGARADVSATDGDTSLPLVGGVVGGFAATGIALLGVSVVRDRRRARLDEQALSREADELDRYDGYVEYVEYDTGTDAAPHDPVPVGVDDDDPTVELPTADVAG